MGKSSAKPKQIRVRATAPGFHNRRIKEGEEFSVTEDYFKACHAGDRTPSWFVRADTPKEKPVVDDDPDGGSDGGDGGEDLT